ncbi:hydrogenase expression/formation C-terminal domain-containing protein [Kaarinaea lacus]
MTELSDIPVTTVEATGGNHSPSSQVLAILKELQTMLDTLVETGDENYVDIHGMPLLPGEMQSLKQILGTGEVDATIAALGPTHVTETSIPGIWWVTHKNANDEIISEFIEVTDLPEILKTQHHDLHEAPERFRQRLSEIKLDA